MKPEAPLKAQRSWEAGSLGLWKVGVQVSAEPSRELWAGKFLHQKAPFTLAFSNVTFAWGSLPASPFCALTFCLIPASGRASGSLGVELFVRYARERESCGIEGAQMLLSPGRRGLSPALA